MRKILKGNWVGFHCLLPTNSSRSALYIISYLKGNRFLQILFEKKTNNNLKNALCIIFASILHIVFVILLVYNILSCDLDSSVSQ